MSAAVDAPATTSDKHNIRELINTENIQPNRTPTSTRNKRKQSHSVTAANGEPYDPVTSVPFDNTSEDIDEYNDSGNGKQRGKKRGRKKSLPSAGTVKVHTDQQPAVQPVVSPQHPSTVSAVMNAIVSHIPANAAEQEPIKAGDIRSFFGGKPHTAAHSKPAVTGKHNSTPAAQPNGTPQTAMLANGHNTSNAPAADGTAPSMASTATLQHAHSDVNNKPTNNTTVTTPAPAVSTVQPTPISGSTTADSSDSNIHQLRARRRNRSETESGSNHTQTSYRRAKKPANYSMLNNSNSKSLQSHASNHHNHHRIVDPSSAATTVLQPVDLSKQPSNVAGTGLPPVNLSAAVLAAKTGSNAASAAANNNDKLEATPDTVTDTKQPPKHHATPTQAEPAQSAATHNATAATSDNTSTQQLVNQTNNAPTQQASFAAPSTAVADSSTSKAAHNDTAEPVNVVQVTRRPARPAAAATERLTSRRTAQNKANGSTPFQAISAKPTYEHPIHTHAVSYSTLQHTALPYFNVAASTCTGQRAETQDDCAIRHLPSDILLAMIADGHGLFGQNSSLMAKTLLPAELSLRLMQSNNMYEVMRDSIAAVHSVLCKMSAVEVQEFSKVLSSTNADDLAARFDYGTTLILCVLQQRTLYVANVGDSRLMLFQRAGKQWSISFISTDHSPDNAAEAQRVRDAGGIIFERIIGDKRVTSQLMQRRNSVNMTRAIGHAVLGMNNVVSSEADISTLQISDASDTMVVMGSDGLFDVVSTGQILEVINSTTDCEQITTRLTQIADSAWKAKRAGGDNITVISLFIPSKPNAPHAANKAPTNV